MPPRQVSVTRVIAATPEAIFRIVADASFHHVIDGSGTVRGTSGTPEPLALGSRFAMKMKLGVPYVIGSTVVEFEQDRRIAWAHIGKHRWRYELTPLEPAEDGSPRTEVTETFDWSTSVFPKAIELAGYPKRHVPNMTRTLERLDAFVQNRTSAL
ncbi:MAG: SRPBCC family protein [Acidimicrobiales bacterium]